MKKMIAVMAAVLAAMTLAAAPSAADTIPDARHVPLRVLSYNIHAGAGMDNVFDLDRTAAAIRATGADVIGLQEVDNHWGDRSDWTDETAELATRLGMQWSYFGYIYDLPPLTEGAPDRTYGLAILSRYPIVHAENHSITRLSTQVPNPTPEPAPGFPEVVVNVQGALVHVYDTHLDYRGDPSVRVMQVKDMLAIMADDEPGAQQVLVGDFNAQPQAPELAPLWQHVTDTWSVAGVGSGHSYPADNPTAKDDYVTVSSGIGVTGASVPDTQASDHRPMLADITVTRGG